MRSAQVWNFLCYYEFHDGRLCYLDPQLCAATDNYRLPSPLQYRFERSLQQYGQWTKAQRLRAHSEFFSIQWITQSVGVISTFSL